jgi:preprotein translocase subunit SecA
MMNLVTKIFGDPNEKIIKELRAQVEKINGFEPAISALTDIELKAKTTSFKEHLEHGESLEDLLPEAFAVVREAAKRVLGQRHYDVQLMGGLTLHRGMIAEMRTGEGKTLTSTAAVYLNALSGKGIHVVTVNDYLAKRDAVWMGQVFAFLGLSVGIIQHEGGYVYDSEFKSQKVEESGVEERTTDAFKVQTDYLRPVSRSEAYAADITYGTNNEFGFDYLRDNMVSEPSQMVQRGLHFAIVDEIDSILVDEARTPLIISAPAEESADLYYKFAGFVSDLQEGEDYNVDEKMRVATFTEAGLKRLEVRLGIDNLYAQGGLELIHHAEQALKAHAIFKKDRDYVVAGEEVKIVDEFTGRIMEGRRYSDGLHQAIEAKEGAPIKNESRTLATITFQNFFRMYEKLSGMTGTAATEAEEFDKIYKLEVVEIPTHRDNVRKDSTDRVYKSEKGKLLSVVEEVKERHAKGQPVLIGTVSIEKNELLSTLLRQAGVPHQMLNAKNHEKEAEIIAQAGRKGAVTVATNMAGRGVDIILGGNPPDKSMQDEVRALGGLHVIGTERHESRRIDNQLRGRAARQGDPGSSQFYVSLEDDLMRIFGSERVKTMMNVLKIEETMPIESKMVTKALEKAQQRVEGANFDTRKHLLDYDDVLNKHRLAVYERRRKLVLNEDFDPLAEILEMVEGEVERVVLFHTTEKIDWNPEEILEVLGTIMVVNPELAAQLSAEVKELSRDAEQLAKQRTALIEQFMAAVHNKLEEAKKSFGDEARLQRMLKGLMLRSMDNLWLSHLDAMTYLRRSIGLRGYGQRDPLVEYKREAFELYHAMLANIEREVVCNVFKFVDQASAAHAVMKLAPSLLERVQMQFTGAKKVMGKEPAVPSATPAANKPTVDFSGVGRNDLCPCGSGKKYKKCHGA